MLFGTKCTEVAAVREAEKALNLVRRSATPPGAIGVRLGDDERTAEVVIREVLPDSPAPRAGLRAGERPVAIDGKEVAGLSVAEVAQRMRGAPGSTVTIAVRREGSAEPLVIAVPRGGETQGAALR